VHDLAFALDLAVHRHQPRADEFAALALAEVPPDDDVERAGLVFECDEHDAARRVRPLPADDDTGGPHEAPVRRCTAIRDETLELRGRQRCALRGAVVCRLRRADGDGVELALVDLDSIVETFE